MSKPRIVVLEYGSGNVHSVAKALQVAGADVQLTADRSAVLSADGLVVPGVGAFAAVMDQLNAVRGGDLIDQRLTASKPVLGICVGLQVMFAKGVEHGIETEGLAQWPGTVDQLEAPVLPHIGWNTVEVGEDSRLFDGIEDERFYFVHSYGVTNWELDVQKPFIAPAVTWAEYGQKFVAAVENGPLSATQFHPEKSGRAGIQLLTNWINSF
ncbi:MAG: imidazole glycerol phosphate synthase subunit HisH [Phenylobacterium zucineum]|nr:MAG: imidazole glycerol phosphate synthase subunit HisH [Phenylobacterium zucineum]